MAEAYQQLTLEERSQLSILRQCGFSTREIADRLDRHRSTIHREVQRNSGGRGYSHRQAHGMAVERRRAASSVARKVTEEMLAVIEGRLKENWSPEQISGRMHLKGWPTVSHTRIYSHIHEDRRNGGDLITFTRRRGKKPNRKGAAHSGRGRILNRVDISERPAVVEEKQRIGDWEGDTIHGKLHDGAILSLVDRMSKYVVLELVGEMTGEVVGSTIIDALRATGGPVHTITTDNGKEFAGHLTVSKALEAGFYFAEPYHSWQRGLNEHTNGLVRQYFPRGTNLRELTAEDVKQVQRRLNRRPRKALGYLTPVEAFHGERPP